MKTPFILLFLHLLFLCDRSASKSYDSGSASSESETQDRVSIDGRARNEKPNRESNFDKLAGDSRTDSSQADFPCPDAAVIAPCICTVDGEDINLDCTFVESQDQLEAVFQQDFPVQALHKFSMTNNSAITVLGNILNGVTFESIHLSPGPFALEQITDYFLFDNKDTLSSILIHKSSLTSDNFPFLILSQMAKLTFLDILTSSLTWIPAITAPSLAHLRLSSGLTETIEAGTFPIHEWETDLSLYTNKIIAVKPGSFFFSDENSATSSGMLTIALSFNQLQSLQAGTFPLRNGEVILNLNSNEIASIEPGTFVLPEGTGSGSSGKLTISLASNQLQTLQAGTFPLRNGEVNLYLEYNQIASIEPGTFVLPEVTNSLSVTLHLEANQLTTVDEAVFLDLMPFLAVLHVGDNPLSCGCDIAWLVLNSDYMARVDTRSTCSSGTLLIDLDPEYYEQFC